MPPLNLISANCPWRLGEKTSKKSRDATGPNNALGLPAYCTAGPAPPSGYTPPAPRVSREQCDAARQALRATMDRPRAPAQPDGRAAGADEKTARLQEAADNAVRELADHVRTEDSAPPPPASPLPHSPGARTNCNGNSLHWIAEAVITPATTTPGVTVSLVINENCHVRDVYAGAGGSPADQYDGEPTREACGEGKQPPRAGGNAAREGPGAEPLRASTRRQAPSPVPLTHGSAPKAGPAAASFDNVGGARPILVAAKLVSTSPKRGREGARATPRRPPSGPRSAAGHLGGGPRHDDAFPSRRGSPRHPDELHGGGDDGDEGVDGVPHRGGGGCKCDKDVHSGGDSSDTDSELEADIQRAETDYAGAPPPDSTHAPLNIATLGTDGLLCRWKGTEPAGPGRAASTPAGPKLTAAPPLPAASTLGTPKTWRSSLSSG